MEATMIPWPVQLSPARERGRCMIPLDIGGRQAARRGHSLVPMMKLRLATPEHLIDLHGIAGLKASTATATGS